MKVQDIIYEKLSSKIQESIEFVDIPMKKKKKTNKEIDCPSVGVRLFKDTDVIQRYDFSDITTSSDIIFKKSKRPEIRRREIEIAEMTENDKLELASVDGKYILEQSETKYWKEKKPKPRKVFNYREKKSILYFVEPKNEFSAMRKKNNWTESKIANFYKNKKK